MFSLAAKRERALNMGVDADSSTAPGAASPSRSRL